MHNCVFISISAGDTFHLHRIIHSQNNYFKKGLEANILHRLKLLHPKYLIRILLLTNVYYMKKNSDNEWTIIKLILIWNFSSTARIANNSTSSISQKKKEVQIRPVSLIAPQNMNYSKRTSIDRILLEGEL